VDSCYLCEMETKGILVPHPAFEDRTFLLCWKCLLSWIYQHPRLAAFTTVLKETK